MKKNGWKLVPLLLALILAASFPGCSKDENDTARPTVGKKTPVEQYTFDGISDPSTTAGTTEETTKPSSGGSYIGGSYMGGFQSANQLPTAVPYGDSSSASTTKAGTTKKNGGADLSSILEGFNGSLSMDNIGAIKDFLGQSGVDTDALGIDIAKFISGLVDDKEKGEAKSENSGS